MKYALFALPILLAGLALSLCLSFRPAPPERLPLPCVLSASVTVIVGDSFGSGVCYHNGRHSFIWTDAHVVASARHVDTAVDAKTGLLTARIRFDDVEVAQERYDDGRKTGRTTVLAKIIRYSERHDIAVLEPYRKWPEGSVEFATVDTVPPAGLSIWHVGSMRGLPGANSLADGVISQAGRLRRDGLSEEKRDALIYDQVAVSAQPGSSGGGIFRSSDGVCLGLITEYLAVGAHGSFLMSPARRLRSFARQADCQWALDRKVCVPAEDRGPVFSDAWLEVEKP